MKCSKGGYSMGRPKKAIKGIESETKESSKSNNCMIRTIDVSPGGVSERLQRNGCKVIAVGGGIIGDPKVHYFDLSLEQATSLIGITDIEEVDHITPSKVIDTGLREILTNSKIPMG